MSDNICRVCGNELGENSKFCGACGAKAPEPAAEETFVNVQPEETAAGEVSYDAPVESVEPEYEPVPETPEPETQPEANFEPAPEADYGPAPEADPEPAPEAPPEPNGYQPQYGSAYQNNYQQAPPFVPAGQGGYNQYIPPQSPVSGEPDKKSKYANIGVGGWIGIFFLMMIPVVNLILLIVWACGGCRKEAKTKFAKAALIMILICLVILIALVLVCRFVFWPEAVKQIKFEYGIDISDIEGVFELIDRFGLDEALKAFSSI